MKVFTDNGKAVSLSANEFCASGGEGSVYIKGSRAFKIYTDPSHAISPVKVQELKYLTSNPDIITPIGVLKDDHFQVIGYEMATVPKGSVTICEFSSRGYQNDHKVSIQEVTNLVKQLREDVDFIHKQQILIVDLNEMNLLLNQKTIYLIDVDSYQTKSFPATAIMEHIKDPHAKAWTAGSDWFSWGIVTFSMFIGMHPYKGKHPDYTNKDLLLRMEKNVSVFNSKVRLPGNCPPIDIIPQAYRDWYKATFEDGIRVIPPDSPIVKVVLTIPTVIDVSNKHLELIVTRKMDQPILDILSQQGIEVICTNRGTFVGNYKFPIIKPIDSILALDNNNPIALSKDQGILTVQNLTTGRILDDNLSTDSIFTSSGRPYVVNTSGAVLEIRIINQNLITSNHVADVMPSSYRVIGEGLLYEAPGQTWFLKSFPREGESYQTTLNELKGMKIITANLQGHVLVVITAKKSKFSRWVFRFDSKLEHYDHWVEQDIQPQAISFCITPLGIAALVNEDNKLEIFQTSIGGARKLIDEDQTIPPGVQLKAYSGVVTFIENNQIVRVKTK